MEVSERDRRFGFDPSVPQPARIYDAWLGGKDHYGVDRETANRVVELRPQVIVAARANRRFLGRAVRYMAERHHVRQFLDIGCGLPARDNTHQIAQRIDPRVRVVYADSDPVVMAHAQALLTSGLGGCCGYIQSDLRDTEYILHRTALTLDLSRPVGVLLLAVLHFIPDTDDPAGIVASLAGALPPGSCVAITHLTGDFAPEAVGEAADAYNETVPTAVVARTHSEVTGLFAGLPMVAPGVVPVNEWRPDVIAGQVVDLYAGVARTARRRL
jgi:O-methyltransferase involved in polyketide biosynthesis